jgi:hypothetical protein
MYRLVDRDAIMIWLRVKVPMRKQGDDGFYESPHAQTGG